MKINDKKWISHIFSTVLSYYLPIGEGMVKMQMAMALGQILGSLCEPVKKWISELNTDDNINEIKELVQTEITQCANKPKKAKLPWGAVQYEKQIETLKSGEIKIFDMIARGKRDKKDTTKIHKGDTTKMLESKLKMVQTKNELQIKELILKKDKLVQKMKNKNTWEEYIIIKSKQEHKLKLQAVNSQFLNCVKIKTPFHLSYNFKNYNFRDLSSPKKYNDLSNNYFYQSIS